MAEEFAPEPSLSSRQKSCHACVRGKRGCDKRHPICSRCEEKKIPCLYAKRTHAEAFYDFNSVDLDMSWAGFTALSSASNDLVRDIPLLLSPAVSLEPSCLPTLDVFVDPFRAFEENQSMPSAGMQLVTNAGEPLDQQPEREQALSKFDYAPMADICIQYEPWHVYDPNTKVHFIVQSLKGYPITFAKENHTPWMHRYLYKDQMPPSIKSCFTASTLYSNMNDSNKTSVFRVLCQSLDELKEQQPVNTPQEKLARTQALFLYQIICLFDGDVTLRSAADRNMSLLLEWLDELCKIRENLGKPQNTNDPIPPRSWEWWIFSESVRRTIVIAYAFLGLWSIMSKTDDDAYLSSWKYLHCWTLARPLWEAPSSFEFFRNWRSYHIIENFELESFVKTGRADDVDHFCRVFMVVYMGLDETKHWFLDRGGVF